MKCIVCGVLWWAVLVFTFSASVRFLVGIYTYYWYRAGEKSFTDCITFHNRMHNPPFVVRLNEWLERYGW